LGVGAEEIAAAAVNGGEHEGLLPIKASKYDLPFTELKCRPPRLVVLNEAYEMLSARPPSGPILVSSR